MLYVFPQAGVDTSAKAISTFASQLSEAEAAGNTGDAGHSIGDTTAGQVMTGAVMSLTTMVRLQEDVLPQSSVAV